jgi:iron complex transport system permease protein
MGSLAITTIQLKVMLLGMAAGFFLSFLSVKRLNTLLLGETYARSMGLNLKCTRIMIFVSTSLLTGSVTAFCGPLGFIGIAIPHLARLFFRRADHRVLLPGSMLLGGIILLVSDLATQMAPQDTQLPINAVTALLGIPIVIWVILRNQALVKVS